MSATVDGVWNDHVVITNDEGTGLIPMLRLTSMYRHALQRDLGGARHQGRFYDREALHAAWDQAMTSGLVDLPDCDNCHDAPGTEPMGDGKTFCGPCCSSAQGSTYDDKDQP